MKYLLQVQSEMDFNIDTAIVTSYMLFCIVIGLFKYGKIKNIRDYTLGTKPFPTTVLLATTFATVIGARQIIGNVEKVYQLGMIFIMPLCLIPISWFILAKLLAPNLQMFRKNNFISLSDIMEHWYGKIGRWITNIIAIALSISKTAISAIAIGYLMHYFLNIPETIGMMIGLAVVVSYSFLGGIISVAFTDVFQFLIFFIALPIACIVGYGETKGIENIWSSLPNEYTQISVDKIPLFISLIFFALIPDCNIPYIQRALIAKNKKQFLQSFIGVAILLIPLLSIVCLIGLITYHNNNNIESGIILYHFIDSYLPIGIKGLMVAGILAVIMSTQDSFLNTTGVLLSHDVCKQIWPSLTNKQELFIARISCVVVALISILLIFFKKGIMEILWLVSNFSVPMMNVPLIAGLLGTRINKKSFLLVALLSITSVTITRFITGVFDTRSIAIGIITSAAILYILHKKHKKESVLSIPKIDMNLLFDKLNARVLSNSFSISSLYTVGVILGVNSILGLSFTNLRYLNILNCSLVATASLLILLLLNEFWHHSLKKYANYLWRFSLTFGLIFIPSYMIFVNDFHILWLCNFVLSITLFFIMTDVVIGILFTLITTAVSSLLPQIFYITDNLITTEFAIISCSVTLIAIVIQIYNRYSITKTVHKEIMHELENIIQKKTIELKHSLNIKEEFLNKLNHEMRIPLSVMINTSDGIYQLWDKLSDKDKKRYLKDIVDNRERFESYTSNILDLADLKQNKFTLNIKQQIDLIKLCRTAVNRATQIIIEKNKNLKIELELKTSKSAIIECDDIRIRQIIDNLLLNAIKYSDNGIIKILVNATKDNVEISVSDQGVGILESEKSKIFEPFFEGSRTKSPAEGKGLGLSVAQQIVVLHKGYIKVEDNKPKGSIFTFTLPYKVESETKQKILESI